MAVLVKQSIVHKNYVHASMAHHASLALAIALMFSTHTILNDEYDAYIC